MKLILNKDFSRNNRKSNKSALKTTVFAPQNLSTNGRNELSFTSADRFAKIISKGITTYTNFDKVSENINNILGDNAFTTALQNAKLAPTQANELTIKNSKIPIEILKTAKYPFVDMPRDILNSLFTFTAKSKPLEKFSKRILNAPILKSRADYVLQEKNRNLVIEILDSFSDKAFGIKTDKHSPTEFNLEKCSNYFKEKASECVTKTPTQYSARDERALNRIVTGAVSATYGGWDFYNISMLQKDDQKEAKKAQKARFKQEFSRMLMSAGASFFTLGVFNKYIKHSMVLNIAVIGITTLLTEVISRLINHTPLIPLTPEQAAKVAEGKDANKFLKKTENKAKQLPLKGLKRIDEENVFGKFINKDNKYNALNILDEQRFSQNMPSGETKKKKIGLKTSLIAAFGIATAAFTISSILKGETKLNIKLKKLSLESNGKIKDFIEGKIDKLDDNLLNKVLSCKSEYLDTAAKYKKFNILNNFKTAVIQKPRNVDTEKLREYLINIKATPEGQSIENLLNKYISYIDGLDAKTISVKEDRRIPAALYNGFTKIFKTVYQIFSLPGMITKSALEATVFKDSNLLYKKMGKLDYSANNKKNMAALDDIIKKSLKNNPYDKAMSKSAELIKKNIKNFSDNPETGELANYARTCVTVISSFFFINDYRNRVLIESKGKDVEKAEVEKNQRLVHKLANFVINGTLMNLFNSIFKGPLNSSLFWAGVIPTATETTNEFLVRKFINQPILPRKSKQDIIDFETKQMSKKGIFSVWSKTYRKLTGKKALSEKAGINTKKDDTKKQNI